jgi:release factor glutamine methyltransferase
MTKNNIAACLVEARAALAIRTEQPYLEAQALLARTLEKSRVWVLTHSEVELSPAELARLNDLVDRRAAGEPLPYLLERWEFYGLEFEVSRAVLIPRPETEVLVELGLDWLKTHPGPQHAADVGTGSGCIAATLAKLVPDLTICALDISLAALQVARRNFTNLGVITRVHTVQGHLLTAMRGPFSLICANLPYIPSGTLQGLAVRLTEPVLALDGGPDGLRLIEPLLAQAVNRLAAGGRMLLEIEISQASSAPALARQYFPDAQVSVKTDLAGLARVVVIDT